MNVKKEAIWKKVKNAFKHAWLSNFEKYRISNTRYEEAESNF